MFRIAICDYSGHPFQVELSRCLAGRGHAVLHLHFAEFQTPKGNLAVRPGDPPGFHVEGIRLGRPFPRHRFLRRAFHEAEVGRRMARRSLEFAADVVIGCNMPLDAQHKLRAACAKRGTPFIFWIQDIYSIAIRHYLGAKLGLTGQLIGRYYMRLEARLLRSSDAVIAISERFLGTLEHWGVRRAAIRVIPNWAPLSEVYPVGKDNEWARRHSLADKFVAMYSGTLGLKHDPSLLVRAAVAGAPHGIHIVVISEGAGVEWLAAKTRELRLANLHLLPFQSMEAYPQVLGAADVVLAMVGEEAAAFSVPSKILSYLAAGKPIVASIAPDNDSARIIAGCEAGFVVEPGDGEAFCSRLIALVADSDLRRRFGQNARAYAAMHFDVASVARQFEEIFRTIAPATAPLAVAATLEYAGGRGARR